MSFKYLFFALAFSSLFLVSVQMKREYEIKKLMMIYTVCDGRSGSITNQDHLSIECK